jgi:hypothetical protein
MMLIPEVGGTMVVTRTMVALSLDFGVNSKV